jgi:hypothetical protein
VFDPVLFHNNFPGKKFMATVLGAHDADDALCSGGLFGNLVMKSIERLSTFCQAMICQGKIPYILPSIRMEFESGRKIRYQTKGKRQLAVGVKNGLGETAFRYARRITYCYYDLESEYFIPGQNLCLEPEEIFVDKDGELFFMLDDAGRFQLYPIIRLLLSNWWQEQPLIPESGDEWLLLIESCEEKDKLSRRLILAPETPKEQVSEGLLQRISEVKDELLRDDRKIFFLWVGCFLLGSILALLS